MVDSLRILEKKNNLEAICTFVPAEKSGGLFSRKKVIESKNINRVDIKIKKNKKIVSLGQ